MKTFLTLLGAAALMSFQVSCATCSSCMTSKSCSAKKECCGSCTPDKTCDSCDKEVCATEGCSH